MTNVDFFTIPSFTGMVWGRVRVRVGIGSGLGQSHNWIGIGSDGRKVGS